MRIGHGRIQRQLGPPGMRPQPGDARRREQPPGTPECSQRQSGNRHQQPAARAVFRPNRGGNEREGAHQPEQDRHVGTGDPDQQRENHEQGRGRGPPAQERPEGGKRPGKQGISEYHEQLTRPDALVDERVHRVQEPRVHAGARVAHLDEAVHPPAGQRNGDHQYALLSQRHRGQPTQRGKHGIEG